MSLLEFEERFEASWEEVRFIKKNIMVKLEFMTEIVQVCVFIYIFKTIVCCFDTYILNNKNKE